MSMVISGVTWILSYRCNLHCRHCFFDVKGDDVRLEPGMAEEALASFKQDPHLGWQHVSGGEPLLFEEELFGLLDVIRRFGTATIGIASNGFWGTGPDCARQTVARLKAHGVTGVCLSADGYHQPAQPIDAVRNAAEQVAAHGLGSHSFVVCCQEDGEPNRYAEDDFALPLAQVRVRKIGGGATSCAPGAQPLPGALPNAPCRNLCCCLGETTPFSPQMIWVDPYGNVMICYGLVIGNLHDRSLGEILRNYRPDQSPLLKTLAEQGPIGLYHLACEQGWSPPSSFADECELCWHARNALRSVSPTELGPDECYPARGLEAGLQGHSRSTMSLR